MLLGISLQDILSPATASADGKSGGHRWRPRLPAGAAALPTALVGAGIHSRAGQAARTGRQFFSSLGQVKQQNSLVQKNIALSWGRAVEETKVEPQWFTTENRENLISALAALTIFILSVLIPPVLIKCPGRDTYRFRFFAPSKYNSEVITENYTELNRNSAKPE